MEALMSAVPFSAQTNGRWYEAEMDKNSSRSTLLETLVTAGHSMEDARQMVTAADILCEMSHNGKKEENYKQFDRAHGSREDQSLSLFPNMQFMYANANYNQKANDINSAPPTAADSDMEVYRGNDDAPSFGLKAKGGFRPSYTGNEPKSNHPVHSQHFIDEVERILQAAGIKVNDRKAALKFLLEKISPQVILIKSGTKTERTFLYDTRGKKRFRTYGDAIKSGALDNLLLKTGSAVLLKSCHKDAESRYDYLISNK